MNLTSLNVYGITEKLFTAFSNSEEKTAMIETLKFGVCLDQSLDCLNDLVFFTKLKNLALCYHMTNCDPNEEKLFNSELLEPLLLDVFPNLESLAIGGLVNNVGASHIAKSLEKYAQIKHLKLLNCTLDEEGLYEILKNGHELRSIDIFGSLN